MLFTFCMVLLEFLLWNMSLVFKVSLHQNSHACTTEFRESTEKCPSPQHLQHWKPFSCSHLCLLTALELTCNTEITSFPIILLYLLPFPDHYFRNVSSSGNSQSIWQPLVQLVSYSAWKIPLCILLFRSIFHLVHFFHDIEHFSDKPALDYHPHPDTGIQKTHQLSKSFCFTS